MDENKLNELRKISGYEAAKFVENNFVVGLGTGRNARCFIDALAERINTENLNITSVPTSKGSEKYASEKGIKIKDMNEILNAETDKNKTYIDIDVDGADQVAEDFSLIKGYGGALTREKVIAKTAKKFICVVDETKISETKKLDVLIPVEVIPFAVNYVRHELKKRYNVNCMVMNKKDKDEIFTTDNGNFIILADFGEISNPKKLEDELNLISGVIENGIFAKRKPDIIIVGRENGVEILKFKNKKDYKKSTK
ncbi:MAG: ribose 5-phosphate isomerase A [Candidatus Altiarchaeales archaeon A3]|nr:MAG: ribose 5-phosphate isomerase A [Candidatus Altiarchaeales archaeon A3]